MTNMTLSIPEELRKFIKEHDEINWSEIARRAMWDYAKRLEIMERAVSKSKLSEKDAKEISDRIKREIARKHGLIR